MSAFMVSDEHIKLLAVRAHTSAVDHVIGSDLRNMGDTAVKLWAANVASMVARYRDYHAEGNGVFEITVGDVMRLTQVPAIHVVKAIHCFTYQACEYMGWENSDARKICAELEADLVRTLPGYDEAPWGF